MPSVWAAAVAVSWPERTWKMTSARCLALAFIYSIDAGVVAGLASLFICSKRLVSLLAVTDRCRFWSRACSRGLKASPLARLTRVSNACNMPSIARCCHWLKVIQLMLSWRQTTAGLHRSVHTANTAWTLSWALRLIGWYVRFFRSVFSLVVGVLVEVIGKFLYLVLLIADTEFEFALFGPEDDGLAVHPSHHIKGGL